MSVMSLSIADFHLFVLLVGVFVRIRSVGHLEPYFTTAGVVEGRARETEIIFLEDSG